MQGLLQLQPTAPNTEFPIDPLQPDPIGTEGGVNLYAYVRNDPLNLVDPSGMVIDQIGGAAWSLVRSGALIPGAQASVQAYAEFEQGNYASAARHAALGLGEVALTVATLGQGYLAIQAARPAISFAGSLARTTSIEVRFGHIARSLEEIGGGIPRLATTPRGATQFIFPNGTVIRFDIQPGQFLRNQGPHIDLETVPGSANRNIHIPVIS